MLTNILKMKTNKCLDCNKNIDKRAKRCLCCAMKRRFKNPKNNPMYIDGRSLKQKYCIDCGVRISHCATRCRKCGVSGERSSFYIDGRSLIKKYCVDCGKEICRIITVKRCKSCETINRMLNHTIKINFSDTDIELKFKKELQKRNIKFVHPHRVKNHISDFYIPELNLIIECDGEYWHSKEKDREKDRKHNSMMRSNGYYVKRLKGDSILKDKVNYNEIFKRYKQLKKERNNE